MKIAFDVSGTLDSEHYGVAIRYLLHHLKLLGHEITIWSNSSSYIKDFIEKYNIEGVNTMTKKSKHDLEPEDHMDICIENDRCQTYLAAKHIIWAHEVRNGKTVLDKIVDGSYKELGMNNVKD